MVGVADRAFSSDGAIPQLGAPGPLDGEGDDVEDDSQKRYAWVLSPSHVTTP